MLKMTLLCMPLKSHNTGIPDEEDDNDGIPDHFDDDDDNGAGDGGWVKILKIFYCYSVPIRCQLSIQYFTVIIIIIQKVQNRSTIFIIIIPVADPDHEGKG